MSRTIIRISTAIILSIIFTGCCTTMTDVNILSIQDSDTNPILAGNK